MHLESSVSSTPYAAGNLGATEVKLGLHREDAEQLAYYLGTCCPSGKTRVLNLCG